MRPILVGLLLLATPLLRFPDVHGDKIVFTYGGDLWTASTKGGAATRLTSHPGIELFAKFSPDGQQIAFTGQYDGDEQVYVVPASGGVPKQLTWYPALTNQCTSSTTIGSTPSSRQRRPIVRCPSIAASRQP